jgi:hypothetical protein
MTPRFSSQPSLFSRFLQPGGERARVGVSQREANKRDSASVGGGLAEAATGPAGPASDVHPVGATSHAAGSATPSPTEPLHALLQRDANRAWSVCAAIGMELGVRTLGGAQPAPTERRPPGVAPSGTSLFVRGSFALFVLVPVLAAAPGEPSPGSLLQAVSHAPALKAARQRIQAAEARVGAAGRLADPEVEGMGSRRVGPMNERSTMWELNVRQPLPKRGERAADRERAGAVRGDGRG